MKTHKYYCKGKKTPGENLSKSTIKDNKNDLNKINSK